MRWFIDNFSPGVSAHVSTHGYFSLNTGDRATSYLDDELDRGRKVFWKGSTADFGLPADSDILEIPDVGYEEIRRLLTTWYESFPEPRRQLAEMKALGLA